MAEELLETEVQDDPQSDIVIEIAPDDRPAKLQLSDEDVEKLAEPPREDEVTNYAKDAQRRIKSMHQANQEWKRRVIRANNDLATATNLAQQLYQENQSLRTNVGRSESALVEQAIQRADAQLAQARNGLKTARAAQDIDAETKAHEDIARYVAEGDRLRLLKPSASGTDGGEQPPAVAAGAPQQPQPPQQRPVSAATQAWVARNPWFNDPQEDEMRGLAMGVHAKLTRQGITDETDPTRYFSEIDKRLRERFPERFKNADGDGQQPQQRTHRPVAVVGGTRTGASATNGGSNGKRHVTLSESQVRIAHGLGLTPEQYAAQLVKEGKAQ